jgi:hypothetical protein
VKVFTVIKESLKIFINVDIVTENMDSRTGTSKYTTKLKGSPVTFKPTSNSSRRVYYLKTNGTSRRTGL